MKFEKLKEQAGALAKHLGIDHAIFLVALELIKKGKISNPKKVFKDLVSKLNTKAYSFLIIDMGQKTYFFITTGTFFPLGNDLLKKLAENKKDISKAKDKKKELLEQVQFFYEEMNKMSFKGFATGTVKFLKEQENEETKKLESLMSVKNNKLKFEGTVKKNNLAQIVRDQLDYVPIAQSGEIIFLESIQDQKEVELSEHTDIEEETLLDLLDTKEEESLDLADTEEETSLAFAVVKEELNQLLNQIKELKKNQILKKLKLIHTAQTIINQTDTTSKKVQVLEKKLRIQEQQISSIFSQQIEDTLDQSLIEYLKIDLIESSSVPEQIFERVNKLHTKWTTFFPEARHPKASDIESRMKEIAILKKAEQEILLLKKEFSTTKDLDKKIQLGEKINDLISETTGALEDVF